MTITRSIIVYITGNYTNGNGELLGMIDGLTLICIITYGLYKYKFSNKGFLKLKEALKIGIAIALLGGAIPLIWNVLLMNFIEPDMINQMLNKRYEEMLKSDVSKEQIKQNLIVNEKLLTSYGNTAIRLFSNLLFGFIISLTGGLIMRKKQNL